MEIKKKDIQECEVIRFKDPSCKDMVVGGVFGDRRNPLAEQNGILSRKKVKDYKRVIIYNSIPVDKRPGYVRVTEKGTLIVE